LFFKFALARPGCSFSLDADTELLVVVFGASPNAGKG
jgi:hypothetical protein